eukprot:GHVU01088495.1.p2 GENE.GHVU01088495.1~~GHVU01088495.1.p2  ORF type:complete len:146 (+),score=8.00 GHVU01088495.1:195-632(+)
MQSRLSSATLHTHPPRERERESGSRIDEHATRSVDRWRAGGADPSVSPHAHLPSHPICSPTTAHDESTARRTLPTRVRSNLHSRRRRRSSVPSTITNRSIDSRDGARCPQKRDRVANFYPTRMPHTHTRTHTHIERLSARQLSDH